ncbi:MAG: DUF2784 domain-containing protein [Terriglobales bacterium]|jgi:hypothetical protein
MIGLFEILADCVLGLHVLFILWLIFGALVARYRPALCWSHIACLVWGILVEVTPWPCPLTVLEKWLELKAGVEPYQGGFVLRYLDKVVYPDILPTLLTVVGVCICVLNLRLDGRALFMGPGKLR